MAAALVAVPATAAAQRTDVVVMLNGDRITGEVMAVSRGKLDYKTDDVGRLSVEWTKVVQITSRRWFEVQDRWGGKRFGRLASTGEDGVLVVDGATPDTLPISLVVRINPMDRGLLSRTKAYLDVGFTLAKANSATTLSVAGGLDYRGAKFGSSVSFDSYLLSQDSVPTTTRATAAAQFVRLLPKRWSTGLVGRYEQNDELDLLGRVTLGGLGSHMFLQTNGAELSASAGLVGTRERFDLTVPAAGAADTARTNLEGLLNFTWMAYRFDFPKLDFGTSLNAYPSLSDPGRVRADLSIRVKYEVVRDFFLGLNFADTFDSRPPDANAANNDYVASFTIGWSYRR